MTTLDRLVDSASIAGIPVNYPYHKGDCIYLGANQFLTILKCFGSDRYLANKITFNCNQRWGIDCIVSYTDANIHITGRQITHEVRNNFAWRLFSSNISVVPEQNYLKSITSSTYNAGWSFTTRLHRFVVVVDTVVNIASIVQNYQRNLFDKKGSYLVQIPREYQDLRSNPRDIFASVMQVVRC